MRTTIGVIAGLGVATLLAFFLLRDDPQKVGPADIERDIAAHQLRLERDNAARQLQLEVDRLDAGAKKVGLAAAERDIAAGRLRLEVGGPPPAPAYVEYWRLLKQRHGIEVEFVRGCLATEPELAKSEAYNERMIREIHGRFGAGVLEAAWRDARTPVGDDKP